MKLMLVGKTGSGKTTLAQRINGMDINYKKTQMILFEDNIIDTPGEYIENKFYYKALTVTRRRAANSSFSLYLKPEKTSKNIFVRKNKIKKRLLCKLRHQIS